MRGIWGFFFFPLSLVSKFLLVLLKHSYIIGGGKFFFKYQTHFEASLSHINTESCPRQNKAATWNATLVVHTSAYQNRANESSQKNASARWHPTQVTVTNPHRQLKLSQLRVQVSRLVNEMLMSWGDKNYCFTFFIGHSHNSGTE